MNCSFFFLARGVGVIYHIDRKIEVNRKTSFIPAGYRYVWPISFSIMQLRIYRIYRKIEVKRKTLFISAGYRYV